MKVRRWCKSEKLLFPLANSTKKNTKPKIGRYASAQGIKLANENTRQKTFKAKVLGVLRVASVTVILSYYFSMLKLFFLCGKLQHEIWQTLSTSLCSFFFLPFLRFQGFQNSLNSGSPNL